MEGDAAGNGRLTQRDWGRGLILLGALVLLFTAFLYVMAALNQEYYGLFTGETHLKFYFVLGILLTAGGAALIRIARRRQDAFR